MRGNGRGTEDEREETMRESDEMRWHGRDVRADLDRRTHRDEIDRRHAWTRGGRHAGPPDERWGSPAERFRRAEGGDVWSGGRMEPSRPPSERSGGGLGGYGAPRYGSDEWGRSGGYGESTGYGGYGAYEPGMGYGREGAPSESWSGTEAGEWGESAAPPYRGGGYGGYGGGPYGGSYGGMGGGEADHYRPAGRHGGPTGAGSLAGTFGETAGWEPERQNVRPGAFAMHSMMVEGRPLPSRRRGWEPEGALVRDVMTRDPRTVAPDTPCREAARLMRDEDAGVMPVVENGRVIGIVTDRDLAMRIVAEGRDTNTPVRDVMSVDVHVCSPDDKLVDAVRIMGEENVRRLPVVDRDDRLRGMLSMTDVAREAEMDYALQEALERIAARRSFWSRW